MPLKPFLFKNLTLVSQLTIWPHLRQPLDDYCVYTTEDVVASLEHPQRYSLLHQGGREGDANFRCLDPVQILFGVRASWRLP